MEMNDIRSHLVQARQFVTSDLWEMELEGLPPWQAFALSQLRLVALVVEGVARENITLKAYSLTYTTFLSIIPLFAIVTWIMNGIGAVDSLKNQVQMLFLDNLMPSAGEMLMERIDSMVANISFNSLGAIGVVGVIFTVLSGMKKLEDSFDEVLRSNQRRPLANRLFIYWSIVTLGPVLLGASTSMQAAVLNSVYVQRLLAISSLTSILFTIMPVLLVCILFWSLYQFLPSISVNISSAIYAGVVVGIVFELAKRTYYVAVSGSFRLNAIYGTIVTLPVTLIWCYFVWILVLVGAVIVYTHQNRHGLLLSKRKTQLSTHAFEVLCLASMLAIAKSFKQGAPPTTLKELNNTFRVHPDHVFDAVSLLVEEGFVVRVEAKEPSYQPIRDLKLIRASGIIAAVRQRGTAIDAEAAPELTDAEELVLRSSITADESSSATIEELITASDA